MDPHTLFQFTNPLAMAGWIALAGAPLARRIAQAVAGMVIPALLSVGYVALILAHWAGAEGGYDSLASVMRLFEQPEIALAGWVHYLAFDLFVGAWIVRRARAEGIAHVLILPCLALTFLFGPAGLVLFLILRHARRLAAPQPMGA